MRRTSRTSTGSSQMPRKPWMLTRMTPKLLHFCTMRRAKKQCWSMSPRPSPCDKEDAGFLAHQLLKLSKYEFKISGATHVMSVQKLSPRLHLTFAVLMALAALAFAVPAAACDLIPGISTTAQKAVVGSAWATNATFSDPEGQSSGTDTRKDR